MMAEISLHKVLRPLKIGPLTIRWLRYLVPLLLVGLAVHLLVIPWIEEKIRDFFHWLTGFFT